MLRSFQNILVPVDLTINTEVAIKKAMELAEAGSTIHLLYIEATGITGVLKAMKTYLLDPSGSRKNINVELEQWKNTIEEESPDLNVSLSVASADSIQAGIEKKAKQLNADLIIISKNSGHSVLPFLNTVNPLKIADITSIPVLTLKPGSIYTKTRTAVIAISSPANQNKMQLLSMISRRYMLNIHLVTFTGNKHAISNMHANALLEVYQWLKLYSNCAVNYALLPGQNKAKAILDYASHINADIVLVNPDAETRIGWPSKNIADLLPPSSKMQVLAV